VRFNHRRVHTVESALAGAPGGAHLQLVGSHKPVEKAKREKGLFQLSKKGLQDAGVIAGYAGQGFARVQIGLARWVEGGEGKR
jgi:hypothetical protein